MQHVQQEVVPKQSHFVGLVLLIPSGVVLVKVKSIVLSSTSIVHCYRKCNLAFVFAFVVAISSVMIKYGMA